LFINAVHRAVDTFTKCKIKVCISYRKIVRVVRVQVHVEVQAPPAILNNMHCLHERSECIQCTYIHAFFLFGCTKDR